MPFLLSHSLCIDNCRLIFSFPSFGGLTTLSSLGSFSLSLSLAFIDSTFDSLTRSVWLAAWLAGRLFQFHSVVQCSSSSRGRLLLRLLLGLHDLIKLWNYTKLNYVALCSGECWWRFSWWCCCCGGGGDEVWWSVHCTTRTTVCDNYSDYPYCFFFFIGRIRRRQQTCCPLDEYWNASLVLSILLAVVQLDHHNCRAAAAAHDITTKCQVCECVCLSANFEKFFY